MQQARSATSTGLLVIVLLLTILITHLIPSAADAGTVEKAKGAVAIVAFDAATDGTPAVGDKFFAIENGKKKALFEVVVVKNGKGKVKVLKGKIAEGMTTLAAGKGKGAQEAAAGAAPADPDAAAADAAEQSGKKKKIRTAGGAAVFQDMTFGLVGGYAMDSQSVTIAGTTSQSMSGTGMSAKAFVDIPVTTSLGLLTRVGAEQFNVQSGAFKTEIMYASVDLLLKYVFSTGTFVPFGFGGLGLHFPISKTSNILDINRISSTTVFFGGAGINWLLGGSTYFQLTGEYGMFPPSNDVSTSFIAVRTGLGFRF